MEEGNANLVYGHVCQEGEMSSHRVSFPGRESQRSCFRVRYCGP